MINKGQRNLSQVSDRFGFVGVHGGGGRGSKSDFLGGRGGRGVSTNGLMGGVGVGNGEAVEVQDIGEEFLLAV